MKVIGTGSYLPEGVLTNTDLERYVQTSDAWITSRTGIKERRLSVEENTSDLAMKAAKRALEKAGIDASLLALIVVATSTPDDALPGVSHQVLRQLGVSGAMAFDLNAACTGFVYAMDVAASLMQAHRFRYSLVIGAEVMSKIIDWDDRDTCVLFGDGAGAVVLEHTEKPNLFYRRCLAMADVDAVLRAPGVAVSHPLWQEQKRDAYLKMKGQEVFKFAVRVTCEAIGDALETTELSATDVAHYVLHQANSRILDQVAKKLKQPPQKFYSTLAQTGNTSAASIPIALDALNEAESLKFGEKVVLAGFGAGLTYGVLVFEW